MPIIAPDYTFPEKQQVRRSFGRAAARYDHFADLQRRVGQTLLAQLDSTTERVRLALDVGSGTGYFTQQLAERFPAAMLVSVDLAEEMLHRGRARLAHGQWVCGDAEALPLANTCADLIYSNLVLQWCGAAERPLAEFARVLRPGATLAFSLFGAETLSELRHAWRTVDDYHRVNDFVIAADLYHILEKTGFSGINLQTQREIVEYASVRELMRELKGLGAHNVSRGRARHLTGKAALKRMESAYQAQMPGGTIRASYEIIRVVARKL